MKRLFILIILLILSTGSVNSQTNRKLIDFTGNVEKDIQKYFSEDNVVADIMDGIKENPRLIELTAKFQIGIHNNYEWFMNYIKTIPKGKPMPYHKNFGMSKKEYDELMILMNDIQVISTGQEKLQIIKQDTLIKFKGTGKLQLYNKIKIDLKNNKIYYKDYILSFKKTIIIDDADNVYKSKWKGYSWSYEYPNDFEKIDFSDLENLSITHIEFTIGQMEKDGRIFLKLKEKVMKKGVVIVNDQIPIMF